ncbi:MAG: T9SS type A sorting domain-containing protein [Bacteroidota bacterium]
MKRLLLICTLLVSSVNIAQVVWHDLPNTPVAPSAGSVAQEAGDVVMTDDGSIFASYIWDDGSGYKIYFDHYNSASGWMPLYSETVYEGLKMIKSRKVGNDAFVLVKTGNSSLQPIFKIFKVNTVGVTEIVSFQLADYQDAGGFDFEMGADANFGYILYRNNPGNLVKLTKIDYTTTAVSIQAPTISATSIDGFDMTIAGDTLFAVVSTNTPSGLLLMKSDLITATLVPYVASSATGELFNGGQPITTHNSMINSDGISKVFVLGYDQGNIAGIEKRYEAGILTDFSYSGNLAEYYSMGATIGTAEDLYYLNNYSPSNANPYTTYVSVRDVNSGIYDTLGAPMNYSLAVNSPKEHRMGYSLSNKRFTVSFYDPTVQERFFRLSNNIPAIDQYNLDQTPQLCEGQYNTVFNNFGIIDKNMDVVTILNIFSSDVAVIDPANVTINNLGLNAFSLTALGDIPGTATISLEVTDGMDTVVLMLPAVTVTPSNPPVYNVAAVDVCSGQGEIDFDDFVSIPGGHFRENMLEIDFMNGIFDTDNSPIAAETAYTLSYEYDDGICYYSIDAPFMYHVSPDVNITQTPTLCNGNSGTASALVSGGATPYQLSQWSSGEQNTNNVSNLSAGQFSYTLIDANNCIVNKYFEIVTSGTDLTAVITDVSCNSQANGAITLTPVGLVAPLTVIWSSGHSTLNLTGVPAGNYTAHVTDATGCSISKTFTVAEPEPLMTSVFATFTACGLSTGSIDVDATSGGTVPYTYAWSNGDTGPNTSNLPWGIYSLTTTDGNNCITANTIYISELGSGNLYGTVTGTDCGAATGAIDTYPDIPMGETITAIDWSNGETTEDIEGLLPNLYICTLSLSNNCHAIKGWDIPVVKPLRNDICVVTVDSATTTNLVVWEPVQPIGIAYYKIYRETSIQGEYALIDTVQATSLSLFNDVVASPLSRSWRYKISAVNACEVEGPLSAAHQTIHLDVIDNAGLDVTINWNAYEGAAFSSYIVWRYTDVNGWEIVASVPTTQFSYTDNLPITTLGLDYMVEFELDVTCTATVWRAQDFNSARSNKEKGQFSTGNGTGDSNNGVDELYLDGITVAPNPTDGMLTISQLDARKMEMEVRSVDGQLLHTSTISSLETQFDMNDYSKGIYFITFNLNAVRQTIRIVKQ